MGLDSLENCRGGARRGKDKALSVFSLDPLIKSISYTKVIRIVKCCSIVWSTH